MSFDELRNSTTFRDSFLRIDADQQTAHLSDSEKLQLAREETANVASQATMGDAKTWGAAAVGTLMGDTMLFKMLAGKGAGGGVLKGMGKGAAGEGISEALEEGTQQYSVNEALNEVAGANIDPMKGVVSSAIEGGLIGMGVGGATGGVGGLRGERGEVETEDHPARDAESTAPEPAPDEQVEPQVTPEPEVPTATDQSPLGPSASQYDELRDVPAYLRQDDTADRFKGMAENSEVQDALAKAPAPTVAELLEQADSQQVEEVMDSESMGDVEAQASLSPTEATIGPLSSLRVTRRGKPFASEKEALLASRKGQEIPVPLNGGGFGVAEVTEVEQVKAMQTEASQSQSPTSAVDTGYRDAIPSSEQPEVTYDQPARIPASSSEGQGDQLGAGGPVAAVTEPATTEFSSRTGVGDQGNLAPPVPASTGQPQDDQTLTTPAPAGVAVSGPVKKVRMSQQQEGLSVDDASKVVDDFLRDYNGKIPVEPFIREKASEIYGPDVEGTEFARTTKGAYHPGIPPKPSLFTIVTENAKWDERGGVSGDPRLLQQGRGLRRSTAIERGAKDDLQRTLRHELLGHYGTDTFTPENKQILLQKLIDAKGQAWLAPDWELISRPNMYGKKSELHQAEEVFARISEKDLPPRTIQAWNDIKTEFSRLLRKTGLVKGPIKEHELDSLIVAVGKGIRSGERSRQNLRSAKAADQDNKEEVRREVIGNRADKLAKPGKPERIIRFSKQAIAQGELPAEHLTRKEAELVTKMWFKQYRGASGIDVQIHATQAELEQALGLDGKEGLIRRAAFDENANTLHIAAGTIANPKRMREILRHEVLAHYGLANVLGDGEYTKLMSRLIQSQKDPSMKGVWDWVNTHYADEDIGTKAEEVVAHLAELEQSAWGRGWDRVVAWVTRALRAVGFVQDGITAAETRNLIEGMGSRLEQLDSNGSENKTDGSWFSQENDANQHLFLPDRKEADNYREQLAKTMTSMRTQVQAIVLGRTPPVLTALGVPGNVMVINRDIVRKANNGIKHDVPMSVIERLPELLHDPAAIFDSNSVSGSFAVLVGEKDLSGRQVMVALHIDGKEQRLTVNKIASVYGRPDEQYLGWAKQGLLRYQKNKNLTSTTQGLQLPQGGSPSQVSSKNVLRKDDIVKYHLHFSAERSVWDKDFPEVVLHGRLADATSHPSYAAAKGGNDAAARQLVSDVLSPDAIRQLKKVIGSREAIALGVHAEEAVSRNAIPSAMADMLGKVLGIEVDLDIMQAAKVGRTAQDGFGRLANQPGFDGPVRKDKPYLIMDDTLTQGGTLANLKGYIENRGGEVLAATALTGKQYSAKLAINSSTIEQLRGQYDDTGLEAWWQKRFGYSFDALTESEGQYLLRAKDADKIRDRVTAAGPQAPTRSEHESARNNGPLPPDGLKFSQTKATADEALQKLNLGPKPDIIDKTKTNLNKLRQVDRGVVSSWVERVIKKANTEVLDALAPIKYAEEAVGITEAADSGYVAARMATGAASTMQATMLYGLPEWKDGVIQRKAGTGEKDALLGIFSDLGKDLNNWLGWMAGHRAEILMGQGRENLLSEQDIAALKGLGNGKEAKFMEAKERWNRLNTATLDLAQEAGLFTAEARAEFESEWYIPFFRESDDGDVIAPFKPKGIANQNAGIKKLKGGEANTNDLLENIFTSTSKLIDASMKNMAAQKTVWNLADTGIIEIIPKPNKMDYQALANGKDRIMLKLEGEDYMIRIEDPDLYRAMTFFDRKPFGVMVNVAAKAKRILTAGITASPEFMLRNFLRDSLSSWAISKDGFKPMIDSIKGVRKTWRMDGSTIDVMFSGASFLGGYVNGNDPGAMADTVRKSLRRKGMTPEQIAKYEKSIIRNAAQAKGIIADAWEKYSRIGEAVENGNREAVYDAAIKSGKSHAQAAFESKDLMDFSMLGAAGAIQGAAMVLPFFNARIQGLGKLTRELRDNPREIAKRAGMLTAMSLGLLAINWDDERYEELPDWDKDTNWHFFVGDQHWRIPKPFEIGVMFGTIPERMVRALGDKDTGAQFGKAIARAIGDTFALNPTPQIVKPLVEAAFNYDSFRGGPIDGPQELAVKAEARYNEQTSLLMRELGELSGLSPKQLEHLLIGYTGTMGSYVMAAADGLIRAARPGVSAAWRADEIPLVKAVYRGTGPAKSTQHMEEFYRMLSEVNQLKRTVDQYRSEGLTDKARELLEEQGGILKSRRNLSRTQQQIRVVRNRIELIQRDKTMGAEEKRQRIDELLAHRNELVQKTIWAYRRHF